jgi:Fe-S-cluster containining protein
MSMPLDYDKALWFGLRGFEVQGLSDDRMEVIVPAPCKAFDADAAEHCRIYLQRPQFCRKYLCPEAKETAA